MALHLLRRVAHSGMDELANWTAKTYKFSFHNDSGAAVRILVEEDPDGMAELEEWKIGDGIPTVGKAGERHKQRMQQLKKAITASKPYQEFTLIRDQTKTVNMRSPVIKCSLALADWNGTLKVVEVQRRLTEGNTFTVHRGYDKSPGIMSVRADCLEHALVAGGVQLGFDEDGKDKEAKELKEAKVPRGIPAEPPPLPPPASEPFPAFPAPAAPPSRERPPAPRPRPTSADGSRVPARPQATQGAQGAQVSTSTPDPHPDKSGGFLPLTGQIRLLHCEEWVPAHFVGLSLGVAAAAGAVLVEYLDRATGAAAQQVIPPEQIPRLIQGG